LIKIIIFSLFLNFTYSIDTLNPNVIKEFVYTFLDQLNKRENLSKLLDLTGTINNEKNNNFRVDFLNNRAYPDNDFIVKARIDNLTIHPNKIEASLSLTSKIQVTSTKIIESEYGNYTKNIKQIFNINDIKLSLKINNKKIQLFTATFPEPILNTDKVKKNVKSNNNGIKIANNVITNIDLDRIVFLINKNLYKRKNFKKYLSLFQDSASFITIKNGTRTSLNKDEMYENIKNIKNIDVSIQTDILKKIIHKNNVLGKIYTRNNIIFQKDDFYQKTCDQEIIEVKLINDFISISSITTGDCSIDIDFNIE
jgi:hypothetical protein